MADFDEPELRGYVPTEGAPRRRRMMRTMRVVVIVGVACLVLPGIITTVAVGAQTAHEACLAWVRYEAPDAEDGSARFELFGPGGIGYECYTVGAFGGERWVASLGIIPVSPALSPVPKPGTDT